MTKTQIWIPLRMPSNNELLRMHKQTYKRLLWDVMWSIRACCFSPAGRPRKRRKITIVAHVRRRFDDDNFRGGLKPLFDGLSRLNHIHNDHPRWIDVDAKQRLIRKKSGEKPWVDITIEPAGEEQPDVD